MTITSNDIFDIVESIAANPGKKDKIEIVKRHSEHELFRRVLVYALDPTKTFNIRPTSCESTSILAHAGTTFNEDTWTLLDNLINRVVTGNAAVEAVDAEFGKLTPKSAELLWRIIRKDFRAGFSESTVNKAISGLIPDFPYMRCCLPKEAKLNTFSWAEGVYSQEKADGMFANIEFENRDNVRFSSRNGTQFPIEPFGDLIADIIRDLEPGYQHNGEMLVLRDGVVLNREIGNGILNSVQQGGEFGPGETPVYVMWDRIPLTHAVSKGKYNVPYKTRYNEMKALFDAADNSSHIRLIDTRIVHSIAEAYKHYGEMLALGKEGTIIKDGEAIWRDGTSKQQVKLKLVADCDLVIKGFTEGNGKNKKTFGSILCETCDGKLVVGVSGFSDKERQRISDERESLIDTIMAVQFNDVMYPSAPDKPYSLFSPRHLEFRTDKDTADTLERVIEQMEAAKAAHLG